MGTLVCKIELDKQRGVTVLVENEEGQTTQKVTMDGTTLTLEVQGSSDTSTFVQDAESITMTCKNFTVDSETLVLRSSKTSTWNSQDTLEVTSSKDMTLQSDAKFTLTAASDTELTSNTNIAVSATSELTMEATNVAVAGQAEVKVDGAQLALNGTAQVEIKAPMATVEASGQLELKSSGLANLKGSLTSVSGQLVKLG
jgi:phage baseplate assembly protein gpV